VFSFCFNQFIIYAYIRYVNLKGLKMGYVANIDEINALILAQRSSGSLCERLLSIIYNKHLRRGDYFIDVGVQHGHHMFPMMELVGARGRGLGIEANPVMSKKLRSAIRKRKIANLKISSVAASDKKGSSVFYVQDKFDGWSSLYESHIHPSETNKPQKIKVKLDRIDNIIKAEKWNYCDFIKLDIENAEFPALMGARQTLKTFKPLVVFENNPRAAARLNGYNGKDFFNFFDDVKYKVYDIFLNEFTPKRWGHDRDLPPYYIAIPDGHDLIFQTEFINECNYLIEEAM